MRYDDGIHSVDTFLFSLYSLFTTTVFERKCKWAISRACCGDKRDGVTFVATRCARRQLLTALSVSAHTTKPELSAVFSTQTTLFRD